MAEYELPMDTRVLLRGKVDEAALERLLNALPVEARPWLIETLVAGVAPQSGVGPSPVADPFFGLSLGDPNLNVLLEAALAPGRAERRAEEERLRDGARRYGPALKTPFLLALVSSLSGYDDVAVVVSRNPEASTVDCIAIPADSATPEILDLGIERLLADRLQHGVAVSTARELQVALGTPRRRLRPSWRAYLTGVLSAAIASEGRDVHKFRNAKCFVIRLLTREGPV